MASGVALYCSSLILLLFAACRFAAALTDGLLPNGDFELGPAPSELNGTKVAARTGIPSWEVDGVVEYITSGQKQGDMVLVVPEGAHAVRLGNDATIKQRVAGAERGARYAVSFSAARTCAQAEKISISASSQSGVLAVQTLYSSNGWDSYAWAFLAGEADFDIVFGDPGVSDDAACGPLIDAVAIKKLNPPKHTTKNLVKNGDFEEGPYIFPNASWGVLIPSLTVDDHSPLPGWMVESLKAIRYIDAAHFAVPQAQRAVELLAGKESAVSQVIRTEVGRSYVLSFAVGDAGNACGGSLMVEAYAGRDTAKVAYESAGNGGSRRAQLPFTATTTRTRIVFYSTYYKTRSDDHSSLCGPVIDDVAVVSVRARRVLL